MSENKNVYRAIPLMYGARVENPIFIPQKHTVMSYRAQQRNAKKKRKAKKQGK